MNVRNIRKLERLIFNDNKGFKMIIQLISLKLGWPNGRGLSPTSEFRGEQPLPTPLCR